MNRNLHCAFTALTLWSGLLFAGGVAGKELPTNWQPLASTAHTQQEAASKLAWMPVYYGYCEAVYSRGGWKLNGNCLSRAGGTCHIGRSGNCPAGAGVKHLSHVYCNGYDLGIDLGRACHF